MSMTSSEHLTYVQFKSLVQGVRPKDFLKILKFSKFRIFSTGRLLNIYLRSIYAMCPVARTSRFSQNIKVLKI